MADIIKNIVIMGGRPKGAKNKIKDPNKPLEPRKPNTNRKCGHLKKNHDREWPDCPATAKRVPPQTPEKPTKYKIKTAIDFVGGSHADEGPSERGTSFKGWKLSKFAAPEANTTEAPTSSVGFPEEPLRDTPPNSGEFAAGHGELYQDRQQDNQRMLYARPSLRPGGLRTDSLSVETLPLETPPNLGWFGHYQNSVYGQTIGDLPTEIPILEEYNVGQFADGFAEHQDGTLASGTTPIRGQFAAGHHDQYQNSVYGQTIGDLPTEIPILEEYNVGQFADGFAEHQDLTLGTFASGITPIRGQFAAGHHDQYQNSVYGQTTEIPIFEPSYNGGQFTGGNDQYKDLVSNNRNVVYEPTNGDLPTEIPILETPLSPGQLAEGYQQNYWGPYNYTSGGLHVVQDTPTVFTPDSFPQTPTDFAQFEGYQGHNHGSDLYIGMLPDANVEPELDYSEWFGNQFIDRQDRLKDSLND